MIKNIHGISKKLLADQSVMNQMEGEFSIINGYGEHDDSHLWSVVNPHKPKGQEHFAYTVNVLSLNLYNSSQGMDNEGQFEVFRRYKEFHLLRNVLVQRFPGLYVPPIPPKKTMV